MKLRIMPMVNQKSRCECPSAVQCRPLFVNSASFRGRVIKELGLRRTDLVVTTKLFWGSERGHNHMGLSRKQCAPEIFSTILY